LEIRGVFTKDGAYSVGHDVATRFRELSPSHGEKHDNGSGEDASQFLFHTQINNLRDFRAAVVKK
jgi:hypothetical protein